MFFARSQLVVLCVALALLVGCGNSGGGGSGDPVDAPSSLAGRTIDVTINSGSGFFATTGTFRVSFGGSNYAIQGDGVNVGNSIGFYSYAAVGAVGTAVFIDSLVGDGNFAFTYTSSSRGTYSANAAIGGFQSGTFRER